MNDLSSARSLSDPDVIQDPFPYYQWALAHAPVAELPGTGIKVIMSYAMCSEAAGRVEDFSNAFTATLSGALSADPEVADILAGGWPQIDTLLTADPPVHTRYRKLVNLAFSMPRVNALEAGIRQKVAGLIDTFIDKGECEFVAEYTRESTFGPKGYLAPRGLDPGNQSLNDQFVTQTDASKPLTLVPGDLLLQELAERHRRREQRESRQVRLIRDAVWLFLREDVVHVRHSRHHSHVSEERC